MKYNFYPFDSKRLVLRSGNKALVRAEEIGAPIQIAGKTMRFGGHINGYCVFRKWQIPFEWWGNYQAPGLDFLGIHGGITYCHTESNNRFLSWIAFILVKACHRISELIGKIVADIKLGKDNSKWRMNFWMSRHRALNFIQRWVEICLGEYVVFGFDTAHCDDDQNPDLRQPEIVLELTEQMEQQLLSFAKVYPKWKKMDRDGRIAIIESLQKQCRHHTELGIGGMLDLMMGGKSLGKSKKVEEWIASMKRSWRMPCKGETRWTSFLRQIGLLTTKASKSQKKSLRK